MKEKLCVAKEVQHKIDKLINDVVKGFQELGCSNAEANSSAHYLIGEAFQRFFREFEKSWPDEALIAIITQKGWPRLQAYLRKILWSYPNDVDEMEQRTLLKAIESIRNKNKRQIRDRSKWWSWLQSIARNNVSDYLEEMTRQAKGRNTGIDENLIPYSAQPEFQMDSKTLVKFVEQGGGKTVRDVFVLRVLDNQKPQEIAKRLKVDIVKVYTAREKYKQILRKFLDSIDRAN